MPPRYVADHGQIFRMMDAQYQRYLLACSTEVRNAEDFGSFVGTALTVTNLSSSDFRDLCDAAAEAQARARADSPVK